MVIKPELEKPYDRFKWYFILETLVSLNLPANMINLDRNCLNSASLRINWNERRTNSFSSSRGLRQGDPISPYLFVLALERLGHRINDLVADGVWKSPKFGRGNGPKVSHINFADDLVLISEASIDQAYLIQNVLYDLCEKSGQKVNLLKSKVFFSKNISENVAVELSGTLGIDQTMDLGIYLGAPLLHQRASKNSYSFLID